MRIKRLCAAATASVLIAALTACGGDDTPAADDSPGVDTTSSSVPEDGTAEEPDDEPSEEPEAEEPEDSGGYDADQLLAAMKDAVAENETTHVTMEIGQPGQAGQSMSGEGDISYAGDSTAMQMMLKVPGMGGGTIEMRLIGRFMYMAIPPMTPPGKFVKLDTNDPNSPMGDLGGITDGDPLATFDAFEAGLEKAEYVGEEDVSGEDMDHYVLTVDAKKAAEAQGSPMVQGMPEMLTYDLWIDDEDLIRRMKFDQAGADMTMTMDDWGQPVSVKAPPAAAIMPMPGS